MTELVIYSKPDCPYCVRAKKLASANNLPYREVDISQDAQAKDWVVSQGHRTVPQIYHGTTHIGGYEDFVRYVRNQEVSGAG